MSSLSPKKLLHSKWTAVQPQRKEKHFMVTELEFDELGAVNLCVIQAVMTKREFEIDWRTLKDREKWVSGWR